MPSDLSEAELIAARITHCLSLYPKISHSMLHVALGPNIPVKDWRPIFDEMVAENVITVEHINQASPSGRMQTYAIISLTESA